MKKGNRAMSLTVSRNLYDKISSKSKELRISMSDFLRQAANFYANINHDYLLRMKADVEEEMQAEITKRYLRGVKS